MSGNTEMKKFKGKVLASGYGAGKVFVFRKSLKRLDEYYDIDCDQIDEEIERYYNALDIVKDDLKKMIRSVKKEMKADLANIFKAHLLMVDDYFDDCNDAIFKMIEMVHQQVPDKRLCLCGELAGRADYVERILRAGVASLSVASPSIPHVKQVVRRCRIDPN